jgi:hypothetical protein
MMKVNGCQCAARIPVLGRMDGYLMRRRRSRGSICTKASIEHQLETVIHELDYSSTSYGTNSLLFVSQEYLRKTVARAKFDKKKLLSNDGIACYNNRF